MPKSNVYAFVIWEESMPLVQLVDFLTINHYAAAISPLHDKDTYTEEDVKRWRDSQELFYGKYVPEDAEFVEIPTGEKVLGNYGQPMDKTRVVKVPKVGQLKKPHRHVYILLDYSAPLTTALNMFAPLDIHYMEVVRSKRGYLRYLCHLDNPEKERYNTYDVIQLGGVDISCIFEKTERDKDELEIRILDAIHEEQCVNITQLQNVLLHKKHDKDAYREVKAHFGYWRSFMQNIYFKPTVVHVDGKERNAMSRRCQTDADGVVREDVGEDAA